MQKFVSLFSLIALLQLPIIVQAQEEIVDPIERVVSAGLMTKDAAGKFNRNEIISRAELASILVKTFDLEKRESSQKQNVELKDVSSDYWAYNDIQIVLKNAVMSGYREGMFFPNYKINRAEAFAIFAQAYGVFQFPEENTKKLLNNYPDSDKIPSWATKSIATALYEGFVNTEPGTNNINPLEPMTRGDMVYALNAYLDRQQRPASLPWNDDLVPGATR
ncbi:MAG: S-layer homology domain-containing protein [Okeania sp. SIO2G4]|uniref:S-layer homology domain-containing protein n=1 Tax=unclassified Okeania TaxID=2634635 RepID=UPI0013BBED1E|nr:MULTISPECIES: S-layer homology domain-containing protein [unclassified Okeania]NEP07321.1 S-layer homology domain-containing protein [Okeania sp. SIO4D6]NEP38487.1 S-layer homology domain-containing protein [Okeania sp. SIO2H7]NEP70399.1 S-layer homology domain-containing protein [Okeania sp. SIO2G5]NEP91633.1 S-layer homology domain-containing protein [Okeania sp. SIO2F5]NEQ92802.1 S-layer homology domain-containing protein [Okeania sp. SIO2G4]